MKDTMIRFYSWLLQLSLGKICLLVYGTILGMAMTSTQVVLFGDWPHEQVKAGYGLPEVQYSWVQSASALPESGYRGDFLLMERYALSYISHTEAFQRYLQQGGYVVVMDRGEGFSVERVEPLGKGLLIEVTAAPNEWVDDPHWQEGKRFWRGLFFDVLAMKVKVVAFFSFVLLHLLGLALGIRRVVLGAKAGQARGGFFLAPFSFRHDVLYPGAICCLFAVSCLLPWLVGLCQGHSLELEEGLMDVATIKYMGDILLSHGYLPTNFDFRAYSLPMDISFYKRTLKELPGVFFYLFFRDGMWAVCAAILSEMAMGLFGIYQVARLFCRDRLWSVFAVLLYGAANALLAQVLAHGHMIYAGEIMLLPWFLWSLLQALRRQRWYDFLLSGLLLWGLVSLNGNVAGVAMLSFGIFSYVVAGPSLSLRSRRGLFFLAALLLPFLVYVWDILSYGAYFATPVMATRDLICSEMTNWLKAVTVSLSMANGNGPTITGVGMELLTAIVISLPVAFCFPALARLPQGRWILLGVFLLLFFSMGIYGPMAFFFEHVPLVVRAPDRTFLPVLAVLLCPLAAWGMELLLREGTNPRWRNRIAVVGLVLLWICGWQFYQPVQRIFSVPAALTEAYASIPQGDRVLLLPLWGGNEFLSLSEPAVQRYKPHSYVGYSLVHFHEYLAMERGVKDAFSPPTKWETLKETGNFYDRVDQTFRAGDFSAFIELLGFMPDLEYLLVYKQLLPKHLYQGLTHIPNLAVHYENEMVTVFRVKRAVSSCAQLYAQAVFVLSTTSLLENPILEKKFAGKAPIFRIGDQTGEIPFAQAVQLPAKSLLLSGDMATLRVHYALPRLRRCDEYYVMPQERRKALGTRLKGRLHKRVLGSRWLEYRLKFSVGEGLLVRMREDSMGEPCQVWVNHAPISQVLQGGTLYRYIPQEYFIEGINEVVLYNFSPIDAVYIVNEAEFQAACMVVEEDIRALRQSSVRTWEDSSPAARRHILEEGITFPPPLSLSLQEESDEHYVFDAGGQSGYFLFDKSYFPLWKFEGADKKEMSVYRANFYLMGGYIEGEKEFSVRYR